MKDQGDMVARVYIYTTMALGRGRVANPTLSPLYPRESPSTHFIAGSVDPRTSLNMKE